MKEIYRSAMLPYSAESMFNLVNDIEAYPEFMDGCVDARVILVEGDTIEACLELKKGFFKQRIITRNINTFGKAIDLELIEGPLANFFGRWEFVELGPKKCKVSLKIRFSIKASIASTGLSSLLNIASNSLVAAVVKRAKVLYG